MSLLLLVMVIPSHLFTNLYILLRMWRTANGSERFGCCVLRWFRYVQIFRDDIRFDHCTLFPLFVLLFFRSSNVEAKKSKTRQPDRSWIVLYCFDQPFSSIFSVCFCFLLFSDDVGFSAAPRIITINKRGKNRYNSLIEKNLKHYYFFLSFSSVLSRWQCLDPKPKSKNGNTEEKIAQISLQYCCYYYSSILIIACLFLFVPACA